MATFYPVVSSQLSIRRNNDTILGYDRQKKLWVDMNRSLEDILLLCQGSKSVEEISREISIKYEMSHVKARELIQKAIDSLLKDGLIRTSAKKQKKIMRYRRYDFEFPLQSVFIETTKGCNLRCIHCYRESDSIEMDGLTKDNLLCFLDHIDEMGAFNVFFTGGEPYVRVDFMDILEYAHEKGFEVGILTNGIYLDDRRMEQLARIRPKFVAISLDSIDTNKYQQIRKIGNERVIANILALKKNGINVRINTVLFRGLNDSYKDLESLFTFLKENGFGERDMAIDEFLAIGRGREFINYTINDKRKTIKNIKEAFKNVYGKQFGSMPSYVEANEQRREGFCGLGENMFYITVEGNITLCTVLNDSRFTAGNIFEKPVKDIWEKSEIFGYFRQRNHLRFSECESCSQLRLCAGGCKAKPMLIEGKFNRPDRWACGFYETAHIS